MKDARFTIESIIAILQEHAPESQFPADGDLPLVSRGTSSLSISGGTVVEVDPERCARLAMEISRGMVPRAIEEPDGGLDVGIDRSNLNFLLVAICHQTSPVGSTPLAGALETGEHARGWDYLRKRFRERVRSEPHWTLPDFWESVSPEQVTTCFTDAAGTASLSDCHGRARLIRGLGRRLLAVGFRSLDEAYEAEARTVRTGDGAGLYRFLAQFEAYSDPVQKKSSFFLELMQAEGEWVYTDPESILPPVDYHEVRGHLRLGTVVVTDENLRARLIAGDEVSYAADIAIRSAVRDAIVLTCDRLGGPTLGDLHYFFWNIFRSCCSRGSPHCDAHGDCHLPSRYREASRMAGTSGCCLARVCASVSSSQKLVEHRIHTHFY